jgi:ribosomal protein S18 acetylase RimI-like enzyme
VTAKFVIEPLTSAHSRERFHSGVEPLDRYFQTQVTQDIRRRATSCYVAVEIQTRRIAGFYTLSAAHVALHDVPQKLAKRLPRYPTVPVARIGRLAVAAEDRGQKLGAALLWDAATRAARSEVTVFAMMVDAKDDLAIAFYRHHGFLPLGSAPHHLVLPIAPVA